jgi:hypothetical protein
MQPTKVSALIEILKVLLVGAFLFVLLWAMATILGHRIE